MQVREDPVLGLLADQAVPGLPLDAQCVAQSAGSVKRSHLMDDECIIQRILSPAVQGLVEDFKLVLDVPGN